MANQNSFKHKFNLILIGSFSILTILGGVILISIFSIQKNVENTQKISASMTNLSFCQASIRGFLLNAWSDTSFVRNGTNGEIEDFKLASTKFEQNINYLKEHISEPELASITAINANFLELKTNFKQISVLIKERGFKDVGIEGDLRKAVHKIENSDLITDKTTVLKLRKHEKDFFLRRDEQYLAKFDKEAAKLTESLDPLEDSPEKEELKAAANTYFTLFKKVVEIEKEIGLTKSTGLKGTINTQITASLENLNALVTHFDQETKVLTTRIVIFIILIFSIILLVVIIGLNKLIKPVFEPMQEIQNKAAEISEGNLSVDFDDLRNNAILKELILGFEKIIFKFKSTMELVEKISSRQILDNITLHSDKDDVAVALNKIIDQIQHIDAEEKKRTWLNSSLTKFAEIIRINNQDETQLYDSAIKELVKNLQANQGALFIVNENTNSGEHLMMKSCYAYDRKKFINKQIEKGEGLVGTCWIEGETIFMTDIPQNYIQITSGLGDANPSCLLIVPIKFNDIILGVIEIASFKKIEDYQIKFIETTGEALGSTIHNLKINSKTVVLLQSSQILTEELKAQEEEMRQNMEELQATQEESDRIITSLKNDLDASHKENINLKNSLVDKADTPVLKIHEAVNPLRKEFIPLRESDH